MIDTLIEHWFGIVLIITMPQLCLIAGFILGEIK